MAISFLSAVLLLVFVAVLIFYSVFNQNEKLQPSNWMLPTEQLYYNWRNILMLTAFVLWAFLLVAPLFHEGVPWLTFIPLKATIRTFTLLGLRNFETYFVFFVLFFVLVIFAIVVVSFDIAHSSKHQADLGDAEDDVIGSSSDDESEEESPTSTGRRGGGRPKGLRSVAPGEDQTGYQALASQSSSHESPTEADLEAGEGKSSTAGKGGSKSAKKSGKRRRGPKRGRKVVGMPGQVGAEARDNKKAAKDRRRKKQAVKGAAPKPTEGASTALLEDDTTRADNAEPTEHAVGQGKGKGKGAKTKKDTVTGQQKASGESANRWGIIETDSDEPKMKPMDAEGNVIDHDYDDDSDTSDGSGDDAVEGALAAAGMGGTADAGVDREDNYSGTPAGTGGTDAVQDLLTSLHQRPALLDSDDDDADDEADRPARPFDGASLLDAAGKDNEVRPAGFSSHAKKNIRASEISMVTGMTSGAEPSDRF